MRGRARFALPRRNYFFMPLTDDLKNLISGEVFDDEKSLADASHDYSLFSVKPKVVVTPKNREDIKKLVGYVNTHKGTSLTVRAAGTDMSGGPLNESIIVDVMKHLNHMEEVIANPDGTGFASTEPGVLYRDFETATLAKGLLFPSYPASKRLCAMGGIVNNNSGGEKTLIYGKTEKYIESISMILRDGEEHTFTTLDPQALGLKLKADGLEGDIYRGIHKIVTENDELLQEAKPKVSKNSSGYYLWNVWDKEAGTFDLTKLIVGAQGTFGIMTEAKIKLIKPKTHSALLVIFINDFNILSDVITAVLKHHPESFESYDDNTFNIAIKYLPSMLKILGASNLISLGWRFLPEFWMAVTGGVPKLVLTAEFTGDSEEEIFAKAHACEADLKQFPIKTHVAKDDKEEDKYWTIRRESFKLLTDHSKGKRTAPFIDDVVVAPEKLHDFLPRLNEIMSHYKLVFTIQGHIGNGNFHIIPLVDIGDEHIKTIVPELEEKVFSLVKEFGGSMTGEHNDGLVRSPYLKKMFGDKVYMLFEETKHIFDPDNIFNPGKKVGETLEYEISHLKV